MLHSKLNLLVLLFGLLCSSAMSKFPTDPTPCKYGELDCILERMNYFLHERSGGDSSINLVKVEPLNVVKINIKQGADSPVNIDLKFTDNKIIGLKNIKFNKASGFGKDIATKHEMHIKTESLSVVGDYTINGKVLILPISGKGKSNMTVVNTDFILSWIGKPYEKDDGTYMKVENLKLILNPERLYYSFSNLFNGDKELGDNMNAFLNENWKDIFGEVRKSIEEAFGSIFEAVIDNVFSKQPYEKYFAH